MNTTTFNHDGRSVTVNYNPDFSGMAVVQWSESKLVGRNDVSTVHKVVTIPAVVLTLGISQIKNGLWELWEMADDIVSGG